MKLCPKCGNKFPDDANFCPKDAGRLEMVRDDAPPDGKAGQQALSGRFLLGERIAGHQTGEIFSATDKQTGVACMVKLVDPHVFATPLLLQRTERELKQLERLDAAGVIKVLDHGKRDGRLWVATEQFDGRPLTEVVDEIGPMDAERAARIVCAVGHALSEAARLGVIHRDLAPKNILLGDGDQIKVINFGVAVPATDKVQGVPEFVAPEQIEGKPVDQRSNIYSLGALYYFLLAGRPPYTGDTEQVHRAHLSGTPPSLSELAPIPTHVEALVLKALERSSSKRFMTLRQLLGELESVVEGRDPATTQPLGRAGDASFAVAGLGKADKDVPATLLGVPAFKASERPLKSDTVPSPSPPSIVVASDVMVEPRVAVAAPDAWKDDTAPAPSIDPQARISTSVERPAFGKDKDRKKKKKADKAKASKTKFRETMWFKKGELDEAAAEAAARQKSADAVMDRADQMPMEDRYADDGSLTEQDRERLSLRTGGTQAMGAVRDIPVGEVSEEELASELAGGRTRLIAAVAAIALVVIIIVIIAAT